LHLHPLGQAATEYGRFAYGMTDFLVDIDQRRFALLIDPLQIRLQQRAALSGRQPG